MSKSTSSFEGDKETRSSTGVVFSLQDEFVLASWPGTEASVNLGNYESVIAMMQDFLEQSALGERWAKTSAT